MRKLIRFRLMEVSIIRCGNDGDIEFYGFVVIALIIDCYVFFVM